MESGEFYALLGFIWVFFWVAVLLLMWHLRSRQRERKMELLHQERKLAMEKGIPLPEFPPLEDHGPWNWGWEKGEKMNPRWPLGVGALLIFAGVGTSLALYLSGDADHNKLWSFGLIGVFIGVGFLFHYLLTRRGEAS